MQHREPARPIDAYKAMVDELVRETSHSVHERSIVEEGVWLKARDAEPANAFVRSLSLDQRRMLARLVHDERTSAIHDILAVLTWWISTRGVGLTFQREPMPVELGGQGLHGDYVGRLRGQGLHGDYLGRLNGWEWPENDHASRP